METLPEREGDKDMVTNSQRQRTLARERGVRGGAGTAPTVFSRQAMSIFKKAVRGGG